MSSFAERPVPGRVALFGDVGGHAADECDRGGEVTVDRLTPDHEGSRGEPATSGDTDVKYRVPPAQRERGRSRGSSLHRPDAADEPLEPAELPLGGGDDGKGLRLRGPHLETNEVGSVRSIDTELDQTIWAILIAHVFFNYAVVVRTVGGSWSTLDPRLEEAARTLGRAMAEAGVAIAGASDGPDVNDDTLSFDGGRLVVEPGSRRYKLAPETQGRLTPGELGLLAALARRPGAVLTRDQLLGAVTRRPDEVYDRVVDVHVANLRRKLGDPLHHGVTIRTLRGLGYALEATTGVVD